MPADAGSYIEPLAQLYCACGTVISAPDGAGYIAPLRGAVIKPGGQNARGISEPALVAGGIK